MAHHAVLSAIVNLVVTDDMGSDFFLAPANLQGAEHGLHLILIAGLAVPSGAQVMSCGGFLADTDAAALGIVDNIVFNDPALAPVSSKKAGLIRRRRRPGAGGLFHFKAAYRNIVHPRLFRVKAAFPHIDFHQLPVGIRALEISVNCGIFLIYLRIPLVNGILRMQDRLRPFCPRRIVAFRTNYRILHILQALCLKK